MASSRASCAALSCARAPAIRLARERPVAAASKSQASPRAALDAGRGEALAQVDDPRSHHRSKLAPAGVNLASGLTCTMPGKRAKS